MNRLPHSERILVVDDEEDTRSLIAWVLKDLGFGVDQAADGWAAFETIASRRPDLLILDLVMPGVDGWAVLKGLAEEGDPPPVLVMSAAVDAHSFSRAVRSGAAGFLFKPFPMSELVSTTERVLRADKSRAANGWEERRSEPRRLLAFDVDVQSQSRSRFEGSKLVDLSVSGAQVDLVVPVEPGAWLSLDLVGPHRELSLLRLKGRVRWHGAAAPHYAHGVAFENLEPESREQLQELLLPR
jgi:DNA-binding response OmpR family regulator